MNFINPLELDKDVEKLLLKIGAEFEPEQVKVIIEAYSKEGNCFANVAKKVELDGGSIHYGWSICKTTILCEAERHAVWESEQEELIDITPNQLGFPQILFVSDNNLIYKNQFIDNIRVNITQNPVVDDFIALCENLGKLYSYGQRVNDEEIRMEEAEVLLITEFERLKKIYLDYIYSGGNMNRKCVCGSPKIYKNCHAKSFRKELEESVKVLNKSLDR